MTNAPTSEVRDALETRRRLAIQEVNLILAKHGQHYMTDRETDLLSRAWMDFQAQANSIVRGRFQSDR